MSTILTHPIVPLALGLGIGRNTIPWKIVALGCFLSIVPDADVIGFYYGISYYSPFGHRGFTHSIVFALTCALLLTYAVRRYNIKALPVFLYLGFSMISHGILDAMTYGGLGVGFAWPFDNQRYFFDHRPLPVSSISIKHFFNSWGMYVFKTEVNRVWLPLFIAMLAMITARYLVKFWKKP